VKLTVRFVLLSSENVRSGSMSVVVKFSIVCRSWSKRKSFSWKSREVRFLFLISTSIVISSSCAHVHMVSVGDSGL